MDRQNADRIITTQIFREFLEQNQVVCFLRSSLSGQLGHCADIIRATCKAAKAPKQIRIIFPSVTNPDLVRRAEHVGLDRAAVVQRLADWLEELVKLVDELAPVHSFELRTHNEPHRWHGVFTQTEGVAGMAWHAAANMPYSCQDLHEGLEARKWMLNYMSTDFDWLWRHSEVYTPGQAKKKLEQAAAANYHVHPLLAPYKSRLPKVMDVLRVIKTLYPDSDGRGITKTGMQKHLGFDKANGNDLLQEMQKTGLLEMIGLEPVVEVKGVRKYGRLLTDTGRFFLDEWDEAHPAYRRER